MKAERLHDLVKKLLDENDFITVQSLSDALHVSIRTIHNDLSSSEFAKLIAPATLIKKPNKGIFLECDNLTQANISARLRSTVHLNYERESDFSQILLKLFCTKEELYAEDLCQELYISGSTLLTLLQEVDTYAKRHHCHILHQKRKGYLLTGNESSIRAFFYEVIMNHLQEEAPDTSTLRRVTKKTQAALHILLSSQEQKKLIELMDISENIINTNYCDEDYNRLLLHLAILIIRTRLQHFVQSPGFKDITTTQEYYYAALKKTYLEKDFHLHLPDEEITYLAMLLMGTRKQVNVPTSQQNMIVLEKFINLLSIRLNVELSNDFELKQNLMNHLKPAINRMKHGIISENPLLEQIRINYTEIYIAVITTIEDLEYMEHIFFDSNEIGYICLHIIAAVNRPDNHKKIRTALICKEGLSIEIFLKNIIESYFHEILISEIYRENTLHQLDTSAYDLILNSTTQHMEANHILSISTNFTQEDHSRIRHYLAVYASSIVKVDDLYQNYLLFFKDEISDQKELLQTYCDYLCQHQYVKEGFHTSVLHRTKLSSTYVARGIALPHGAKDQVLSSVILMIRLTHSILWDGEETDFVILVAANDSDVKNYSYLFRKIMKIAAHDESSQQLKSCENLEQLKLLLNDI